MKTRVLLAMLIIFIVVAGVCITCGTVFVIRNVDIVDVTVVNSLDDDEKNALSEKSGLTGKNILFNLKQDQIAQSIKSVNPMFKLHSVTAKFPNRVVLVVSRRVPVFYDKNNKKWFDSEMCVVDGTGFDCVDISDANLVLRDGLSFGDLAVGDDQRSQAKIDQLKVVATFFDSMDGFEIMYDDTSGTVGSELLCLKITIKTGVTFTVKIKPEKDLRYALEYTSQIYQANSQQKGEYRTLYDNSNHVYVHYYDLNGNLQKEFYEGENA